MEILFGFCLFGFVLFSLYAWVVGALVTASKLFGGGSGQSDSSSHRELDGRLLATLEMIKSSPTPMVTLDGVIESLKRRGVAPVFQGRPLAPSRDAQPSTAPTFQGRPLTPSPVATPPTAPPPWQPSPVVPPRPAVPPSADPPRPAMPPAWSPPSPAPQAGLQRLAEHPVPDDAPRPAVPPAVQASPPRPHPVPQPITGRVTPDDAPRPAVAAAATVASPPAQPVSQRVPERSGPAVAPRPATPEPMGLPSWLRLDAITLLLYLGAALVVIAAGVFVASAWTAIPGIGRWALVVALAGAFLGVGEMFIRRRDSLKRAGETFRSVGLLLVPFTALAFDRFVLDGNAPPLYWLLAGAALGAFYYFFYWWRDADYISSALATVSIGIVFFNLLPAVGLGPEWRATSQIGLAWAMLVIAHRVWVADGKQRTWRLQPLSVTHLLAGVAMGLISLYVALLTAADFMAGLDGSMRVALQGYLLVAMGLFAWLAWVGSTAVPVAGVGVALAGILSLMPWAWDGGPWHGTPSHVLSWGVVAMLATALAPRLARWRNFGEETGYATGLVLGTLAFFVSFTGGIGGAVAFSATLLAVILLLLTRRYRNVVPLVAAVALVHVALYAFLAWLRLPVSSPIPALAFGGLAVLLSALSWRAERWLTHGFAALAYPSLVTGLIAAAFGNLVSLQWAAFGFAIESGLLLGMAHRFRQVSWLVAALISGHVAVYLALTGPMWPAQSPIPVIAWGVLATALFLLAPAAGRWMKSGYEAVAYSSLITGLITAFFGSLVSPLWASFGFVVETALLLGLAHRFRQVPWLVAALVSSHVAAYLALTGPMWPAQSPIPVIMWGGAGDDAVPAGSRRRTLDEVRV